MQSTITLSSLLPTTSVPLFITSQPKYLPASNACTFASIRSNAQSVNYNSVASVFPAEACETVGGDACLVEMYPEVKPEEEVKANEPKVGSEPIEREYLEYTDPKTVLLGDACDVLGGEFCEQ